MLRHTSLPEKPIQDQGETDLRLLHTRRGEISSVSNQLLKNALSIPITQADLEAALLVEQNRPPSLRDFDQIPMRTDDLIHQVKLMATYLANRRVVFVGDADCTSLLIGLLSQSEFPTPSYMLVMDFDERLLVTMRNFADRHGFGNMLGTRLYNVFEPVPADIIGTFDWFYTNPPYGCRNRGESARLFISRGCEMTRPFDAKGCIIIPDDNQRPWTRQAMADTQFFLCQHGWMIDEKINQVHKYHLDDDRELASSLMIVKPQLLSHTNQFPRMPYAGRCVEYGEIIHFYGRSVHPPYPRYIRSNGVYDYDWGPCERNAA